MWDKLEELDIFSSTKMVELKKATPAEILQKILMEKWTLQPSDKDMIVMYHKFGYELNGEKKQIDSTMVVIGEDDMYTAMAKTVGLPLAIVTLAILNEEITTPGVQIPLKKEVYERTLKELENYDIKFKEKEVPYFGYNPLNL
jgi:saccharopine dehydrogenase (NAD+, L-glutamate forming)